MKSCFSIELFTKNDLFVLLECLIPLLRALLMYSNVDSYVRSFLAVPTNVFLDFVAFDLICFCFISKVLKEKREMKDLMERVMQGPLVPKEQRVNQVS